VPPTVEELKALARASGLGNLFLPSVSGLSNLEYGPLAEVSGWCRRPKESSSYSWNLAASLI
jgi:hypothetical protein